MSRRKFVYVAAAVALLALAWLGASLLALGRLMSRERPRAAEVAPEEFSRAIEDVRLTTSDGEELGAWYFESSRNSAPSVLELHGNGGSRRSRLGAASIVRERGCAVLLVTLRAHGDSSGERVDFGWSSREDVLAAVAWLERRRPGREILIHGASLGAAAAVFAARDLGERVSGYALECLYRDLDSAARRRCELHLPPVLDALAWHGLRTAAALRWPEYSSVAPIEAIASIPESVPVLLLAGGEDLHAPLADSQALHDRIATHARLTTIAGAPHDRLQASNPAAYRTAVLEWLDSQR